MEGGGWCYNTAMLVRLSDTNMVTNSKLREHILLIRMRQHDSVITGYIIRKNNDKYILCYVTTGFAGRSSLIATTSCADMFYSSQALWAGYNTPFEDRLVMSRIYYEYLD